MQHLVKKISYFVKRVRVPEYKRLTCDIKSIDCIKKKSSSTVQLAIGYFIKYIQNTGYTSVPIKISFLS